MCTYIYICMFFIFGFALPICRPYVYIYMFSFLDFASPTWRPYVHMCVGRGVELGGPWVGRLPCHGDINVVRREYVPR